MTKVRARYNFAAETDECVFITDCNDGAMSITNDAEAVVEELNKKYPGKRVIYRDTGGRWDELVHFHGVFTKFAPYHGGTPPFGPIIPMDNFSVLKRADALACLVLNEFKDRHHCSVSETCLVMSVMWGRLRRSAGELGANILAMDNQFLHDARIITNNLDDDEEVTNEKEN